MIGGLGLAWECENLQTMLILSSFKTYCSRPCLLNSGPAGSYFLRTASQISLKYSFFQIFKVCLLLNFKSNFNWSLARDEDSKLDLPRFKYSHHHLFILWPQASYLTTWMTDSVRHWVPVRVTTGFRGKSGCRASLCKDGAHMAQWVSLIHWRRGLMEGCQAPRNFWQGVWGHVWSGQERTRETWLITGTLLASMEQWV